MAFQRRPFHDRVSDEQRRLLGPTRQGRRGHGRRVLVQADRRALLPHQRHRRLRHRVRPAPRRGLLLQRTIGVFSPERRARLRETADAQSSDLLRRRQRSWRIRQHPRERHVQLQCHELKLAARLQYIGRRRAFTSGPFRIVPTPGGWHHRHRHWSCSFVASQQARRPAGRTGRCRERGARHPGSKPTAPVRRRAGAYCDRRTQLRARAVRPELHGRIRPRHRSRKGRGDARV